MPKLFTFQQNGTKKSECRFPGRTSSWLRVAFALVTCLWMSTSLRSYAQNAKVSVNVTGKPVSAVLEAIESQTDYDFFFNNRQVDITRLVSISAKDKSVFEVLDRIFAGTDVSYSVMDNKIILSAGRQKETRKGIPIEGKVVDASGEPVPGAAVMEHGTGNGVITDMDGRFLLNSGKSSPLLDVSCLGYADKQVKAEAGRLLVIVLTEELRELGEVVVIGYTTQKKGLLTGSVATMKVDEGMKTLPTTSAGTLLAGKLAGVNVGSTSSLPGSSPSISIRTGSSWNAQNVTYVIDGVVRGSGDFNSLSPNEIEDITVLKDAASAAIYGSRSAGGVIIVTTKKGSAGRPVFNYSFGYSVDSRTKNVDLTDAIQAGELYGRINGDSDPAGWAWSQDELDYFKNINNGWGYDQLRTVWRDPTTHTHQLSVSGGGERIRYFAAASYVKQEGFMKNLSYDKYNLRMNVTADITKNLEWFTGFALYNNFQSNATFEGSSQNYSKLRVWQPDQPVYTESGKYVDYGWIANMGASVDGASGYNRDTYLKPQLILAATYKVPFIKGLSAKVSYSRSWANNINKAFYTNYDLVTTRKSGTNNRIISTRDEDIFSTRKSTWVGKEYIQRVSDWSDDKQFNVQANYDRTFGEDHHVTAALVTEWYEGSGASVYGGRETFPVYRTDQFWAASSARADTWGGGNTDWISGRMSYIGQFNYSYANKYLLNFSFREDGSMNFAPGKRWGFFPAASAGWVVSEENFFNVAPVDFLKLRFSVGLTGNDSVGGWQWQESYNSGYSAYFGTTPSRSVGITYGSVVNPALTWEKALSYNAGVDFNFLHHWNSSLDYWYRNSYDILGNRQNTLPSTFSLSMPAENYGEIHAQGFDFQLGYHGQGGDFTYSANLTMSYGWNKVIKRDYAENAQWIDIPVGKSMSYITGYSFDRIIRTQAELDAFNSQNPDYRFNGQKPALGMMVYKDLSGPDGVPDGIVDSWDRIMLRKNNFPVVYGLNLAGSWKGLHVDMMLSGRLGEKKFMHDLAGGVEWNRMWNKWYYDSWTPDNPNATLPRRVSANNSNTYYTNSEFWLKDASFLRMKYLTLSYDLPGNNFYSRFFDNVRFFVTGTNLFVLSSFNRKYYDPEISGGNAFPVLRSVNFGFDVRF